MKLLPDGFKVLFAPAAAPPALRFGLPPGEVPSPVPVVVRPIDDPVVAPLGADPPAAEPLPLCAKAKVLVWAKVRAKAAASPMLVSFMMISLCSDNVKPHGAGIRSCIRASHDSNEV
jgi:hypothetical protein